MNDEPLTMVARQIRSWPGGRTEPGRFRSNTFLDGRHEIGHVHLNGVADLPVPRAVHDELIAAGRAHPHQTGVAGFVSDHIRSLEDLPDAVARVRMTDERRKDLAARGGERPDIRSSPREARGA